MPPTTLITAGVDVGGPRKGFHAVVLKNGRFLDQTRTTDESALAQWLINHNTRHIGIDSPCRWRATSQPRLAETALAQSGISCFFTPGRSDATAHPTGYYNWMLQGEKLYLKLNQTHPLYSGNPDCISEPACFETYPHAIACRLSGQKLQARHKLPDRARILQQNHIMLPSFHEIDFIDAALCALMALQFSKMQFTALGDTDGGLIILPNSIL
ncbi:MAG: DUF429 domain-containing protein [bacterium]